MKRDRVATAWIAGILAALCVATGVARAQEQQTVKGLMGDNFAAIQTILIALITSNYASLPAQLDRIEEHATQLTKMVPENAQADRERFLAYAYNLRGHAVDLNSIVHALIEHDKGKKQLAADSLREAAAAHFGGMVTMCVACHNQFRPRVIR